MNQFRETDRQRDGETEKETQRETEKERDRDKEKERQRDRDRDTERDRDRERERERERQTDRDRKRETDRQRMSTQRIATQICLLMISSWPLDKHCKQCSSNQSVENAGVAFVKGANERNKSFEKINNQ